MKVSKIPSLSRFVVFINMAGSARVANKGR